MDKRICKTCKVIKSRIPDGQFRNGKNKKWRDDDGLLWSGSVCGPCNRDRLKEHMKSKRTVKFENGSEIVFSTNPSKDPLKGLPNLPDDFLPEENE